MASCAETRRRKCQLQENACELSCQDTALKERHRKLRLDSSTILPTSLGRSEPSCSVGASMNFPVKTQA